MKNQKSRVVFGINVRALVSTLCSFAILMMPFAQMAAATRAASSRATAPPVVTATVGTMSYTECDSPAPVDSGVTVTDADSTTLASGTVSITNNFHAGEDVLAFVNNSTVNFGDIQGSYTSGILSLSSLSASATVEQWQNALRAVTYANTSPNPSSDTRTITFVVNDGTADSNAATRDVSVTPTAAPTITPQGPTTFCDGFNVTLTSSSAASYQWYKDGSLLIGETNQNYVANASGSYTVTNNGCDVNVSDPVVVTVNPNPPTPTITPTPAQVCANSTGNSAAGPAGATTYAWSIVNGTITSATNIQTITYTAGASGTVDLTLVVTNASGCSASNTVNVTINANPTTPTITPTPAEVCANFTGNTAAGPAGATTYAWSIVNGTITSATNIQTITYTAGASGTVDLTLVVTNASGCSASNTVNVTINANPTTPTITPTPAEVCANFTGNTAAGPAGATTYAWSIVNGTITSATNIQTITYTAGASGTVDLTLVATNASGCSASNTVNVTINANPATPTITPTPAQVCANSTGNSAAGPAGATTYAWSIVNGTITSATNIQTITYTAGASGTVDLTLVATNASGCSASNTVNVTINANPATPTITPSGSATFCDGGTLTSSSASGNQWYKDGNLISGATNATYSATASGNYTVTVTDGNSCTSAASAPTTVTVQPTTITVTNTSNSGAGSLRQAIADACASGATISFDPALTSSAAVTITLTSGELVLDKNITINGATNHGITISGNNASRVFNIQSGKSVTLSTLTISNGLATQGGGILNAGTLIITNSTVSNNHTTDGANSSGPGVNGGSSGGGGGIYNANTGTLKFFNSTISGNQPGKGGDASGTDSAGNGGNGGGILNAGGSVTSVNTTITNNKTGPNGDNTTTDTPGPFGTPGVGGGIYSAGGTVILRNTIVAGNFSVFQQLGPPRSFANSDDDINGAVDSSSANNLVGVDTGMTGITNGNQGNKVGTAATPFSALLTVLADNGGPTFTHEPQTGSPAIDAGDNTLAKDQNNNDLTTDQRGAGFDRIINSIVDMGSVESNPNLGSGSVVDLGVSKLADADQVVAGSNVTYTITVTSGGPDVVSATLTDNLPIGTDPGMTSMQFVSLNAPAGWGCTTPAVGSGGQVKCTRSLAPTSGQVFTLVGKIPAGTVAGTFFNNQATVSTTAVDPNDENNASTASTAVTPPYAELSLIKTGPSQVHANSDVTYTITVTNPSANAATNVNFSDSLPNGVPGGVAMTFVSFLQDSGPVWNCGSPAATTNCSIASLPGGITSVFSFVGHVPAGVSDGVQYTNQTTVFSDLDPNSENDTGNVTTTILSCFTGLSVTSNADSGPGTLRQAITDACDGAAISFDMTQLVSPITLTSAELLINKNLTIVGPGADLLTVQRSQAGSTPNFRVFNISAGTVSISGLTISNGSATTDGGGVRSLGTLTLSNCSLSSNQTTTAAGGLYVENADATVSGCTFTGNTAATSGSAVGYRGFTGASTHTLSLTNSTFSSNTTSSGLGAVFAGPGTTQLTNCTIANNTGTGIDVQAFLAGSTATVVVGNTIVANNSAASVSTSSGGGATTVFTSQGNNLTSDNSAFFNQASDIKNTDPLLGALANNGGPTRTRPLLAGSAAIDAGNNALVTNPPFSSPPFTDQRGTSFGRIVDGPDVNTTDTVDIGAFEAQVSVEDVSNKATNEDTQLQFTFNVGGNIASVTASSSNTTLVPNNAANIALSGSGSTRTLTINPVANLFGTSTITLTVNGNNSQSMTDTFVLTVNPVGDVPSVTNASTTVNTQTTSGLVITKNAVDGAEITHFKLTNITNGTLFKNDGTTQINNGDFVTAAEGGAGLKFTPALNSTATGSFDVQGALGTDGSGLSSATTATITVSCGPTVVTTNADSGAGSLRDIILHACTGATITFDPALNGQTITLTTSELLINKNLTLTGPGANLLTISGNNARRIFNITIASSVSITGLTLRSGRVASGGTNQGGAIFNAGNLALASDTVSNSSVQSGANSGGGIFNAAGGTLAITGSTVTGNQASAGTSNQGGGIANLGTLTITNSTIDANNALNASGSGANNKGGGIYSEGTLTVTNSEISNNFARGNNSTNEGGGIYSAGNATITSSTLLGNIVLGINGSSSGFGGGVRSVSNKLTIINSTIAHNQVIGNNSNFGGGIENGSSSTLVLISSTVASNSVAGVAGGVRTTGPANVKNTIIANNSAPTSTDVDGTFNSQGHNLIRNISGSNGFGVNGDITGVDPLLSSISNYGGPTQTMPLRPGSPAFDAGDNCVTDVAHCSDPDTPQLAFDQRGTPFARSVDGPDADTTAAVDIGAFEAQVSIENIPDKTINEDGQLQFTFNIGGGANVTNVLAVSLNPTLVPSDPSNIALSGSGSTRTLTINPAANKFGTATILVNVVGDNNQSLSDDFVLTVNSIADTPSVTNATTTVNSQTTSGLVISRNPADGAEVTNFKITNITGGTLFKNDGTTQINNNDFITFAEGNAGLKFTPPLNSNANGSFQVQASLSGSDAGLGGGLVTATITVNCGATVVTNSADSGAGSLRDTILHACTGATITFDMNQVVNPITLTSGQLTVNNNLTIQGLGANLLTVQRSTAGGTPQFRVFGINSGRTVGISGLTISNGNLPNSVGNDGGGILNQGTLALSACAITGNTTARSGGGIANNGSGSTMTISGCTISGNSATSAGSGIFINGGTLTVTNSTITGNATDGLSNISPGVVTLLNDTFSGNTVRGISNNGGATMNIGNTIVANTPGGAADVSGSFNSLGNNLIGNNPAGSGFVNGVNGDKTGTAGAVLNPGLAPLGSNGGTTETLALLPGSPAIDAGRNAAITNPPFNGPPFTDQRGTGFNRTVNGTVDIGAFESRGFTISVFSGSPQSASIFSPFASPLIASVTGVGGEPVNGGIIVFTAPATNASATLTGGGTTANVTIAGGQASTNATANGTPGSYNVIASANGATSASFSLTNNKAPTTTAITSSVNPSDRNQDVTFTATVTSVVTPTGLVQFKDNGANFGAPTALNASGVAQVTTGALTVGSHTITADYLGEANFLPSSGSLTQTVVLRALIKFSQANYSVNENGKFITITVVRSNDTSLPVTVDFSTTDDSAAMTFLPCSNANGVASPRCDFTTALGTLRFAPGETTKTFDVLISQDVWLEGNETAQITLSNLTGGAAFQQPSDANAVLTIVDDDSSSPSTNAIDDSTTFVRQHYHDFLNREADATGLNFWVNQIESCGADAQCRAVKRINVSAAFFLSIEFQNTGYFVERMYKAGFGDIAPPTVPVPVRFTNFLADSQQITNGVVVGVGNWQAQLDNNKKAFTLAFVQRTAFVNRYPAITSATAFVDSLNANAGMVLSDAERSALISQLTPNPADAATRADVLMKVAENALLQQREFNRAFVLMQYFGYLRRNPDAAPEATLNFNGYNFWLNKLNQANGDYVGAELIKAFITSSEYRGRFGP